MSESFTQINWLLLVSLVWGGYILYIEYLKKTVYRWIKEIIVSKQALNPPIGREEVLVLFEEGKHEVWNGYRRKHKYWYPDLSGETIIGNLMRFDMTHVKLLDTDLHGAIMTETVDFHNPYIGESRQGLKFCNLEDSLYNRYTLFPEQFNPEKSGAIYNSDVERHSNLSQNNKVFFSYSWENDKVVRAIYRSLTNRNINVLIDVFDFSKGAMIDKETKRIMHSCNTFVFFYSKATMNSKWIPLERQICQELEKKSSRLRPGIRIIYLSLDETPLKIVNQENRIAILTKGRKFEEVCNELFHTITKTRSASEEFDPQRWNDYTF